MKAGESVGFLLLFFYNKWKHIPGICQLLLSGTKFSSYLRGCLNWICQKEDFLFRSMGLQTLFALFFFHHQRDAINSIMLESTKSTFRSHLPHNFSSIKVDFLFKARFPYLTYLYSSKKGFILFCFHDSIIHIVLSYTF